MASYDSRYYSGRRQDPYYTPSQDTTRYSSRPQSGYEYSYDPRYSTYAQGPPQPKRSSAYPLRTESRTTNRWPPRPTVEDEIDALAKEFPAARISEDESTSEQQSRGTVDQFPIIEEIEPAYYLNDERRFVLVSDHGSGHRDERRRSFAERGNMPHLKTNVDEPPVFTERISTPYAYTKPSKETIAPSPREYVLSPEPMTPKTSNIPRSIPQRQTSDRQRDQNARPAHRSPSRHGQRDRPSKNYVFDDDDDDLEPEDTTHLRTERRPARYSFVKNDFHKEDLRTNLRDLKLDDDKPRKSPPPHHAPKYSGSGGSPSPSKRSTPTPPSPKSSTSSFLQNSHSARTSQNTRAPYEEENSSRNPPTYSYSRPISRPSSPLARNDYTRPPSRGRESPAPPPRPPKIPTFHEDDYLRSSRPSSKDTSRPPTPVSSSAGSHQVPYRDADRYSTYPPVTDERSRQSARYTRNDTAPPMLPPRVNVQSPSPARPSYTSSPLPYPVDEGQSGVYMPSEQTYQVQPPYPVPGSPNIAQPYPQSPQLSSVPDSPRDRYTYQAPPTPRSSTPIDRRTRPRSDSARSHTSTEPRPSTRKRDISVDMRLPSCPRREATQKYSDWYTLEGYPDFDICPTCYTAAFAGTFFEPYFKQIHLYEAPRLRVCDFSSPWVRIAWLLTAKQKRKSPDLIYALAALGEHEKCPGEKETVGPWYGIPDARDGVHVANFRICACDVHRIEALFPSMKGIFTIIPSDPRIPEQLYKCSVRVGSRRFPKYLDLLVEIDEEAWERGRKKAEMGRFVRMAREFAFRRECERDKVLFRQPWHFVPGLEAFAVCEECYDDVVWPLIRDGNRIAASFNRTMQLISNENPDAGTSCCLYGENMRAVWKRACEEGDFGYLRGVVEERRRVETRLGMERRGLVRLLEGGGVEREAVLRGLGDIEREWRRWE